MELIYTVNSKWDEKVLCDMCHMGIHNYRMNAAHLTRKELKQKSELIYSLSDKNMIFFDLPGSKARLWFGGPHGAKLHIKQNDVFIISLVSTPEERNELQFTGESFFSCITNGDVLTVRRHGRSDLALKVVDKTGNLVEVCSMGNGIIGWGYHLYNKNDVVEHFDLSIEDMEFLSLLNEIRPDYVCLSFTDNVSMLKELKKYLEYVPKGIIAKIETIYGVSNIRSIAQFADGLIIGRDDLSAYYSIGEVDEICKKAIEICSLYNKISIPASNYFNSLCKSENIDSSELAKVKEVCGFSPQYIYCNETNKCAEWKRFWRVEQFLKTMC